MESHNLGILRCGDFAERLHNNAEKAGIRAAYVTVRFEDDILHTLVAFNTTDRGLVFIDSTGIVGHGPANNDRIVDVQVGEYYIPISLFPEVGWDSTWGNMGLVNDIFITWNGEWN